MSVAPGDPVLDLTPTKKGFNLFACCMPKKEELEREEQQEEEAEVIEMGDATEEVYKELAFDLPELVDEEEASDKAEGKQDPNQFILISFLQMLFAMFLLNFNEDNRVKAITVGGEKEEYYEESPENEKVSISTNSTSDGFEVSDLPEIAAAE